MRTVVFAFLFLSLVALLSLGSARGARQRKGARKGRLLDGPSSLLKMPHTLTVSATHDSLPSIVDDPEYNMVSLDRRHVAYIADNRLYYHRIPHQRLVLHHEDIREMNGLPRHLLESVRPFFPFFVDY